MNLKNHARAVTGLVNPLTSQRIKRIESIVAKLRDDHRIDLVNMQDIGGCRAIVANVSQMAKLAERHLSSRARHTLWKPKVDYLTRPRHTGYRGIRRAHGTSRRRQYESRRSSCLRIRFATRGLALPRRSRRLQRLPRTPLMHWKVLPCHLTNRA
jgi:hypothetical protein